MFVCLPGVTMNPIKWHISVSNYGGKLYIYSMCLVLHTCKSCFLDNGEVTPEMLPVRFKKELIVIGKDYV